MKIPKSIRVGGFTYKVEFTDNLWRSDGYKGCVCWHTRTITLDVNNDAQEQGYNFLHEVTHAVDKHFNQDGLDEKEVSAIANGLYQVLSDMGITFSKE